MRTFLITIGLLATQIAILDAVAFVNPVKKKILNGVKPVHFRFFAKIPDFQNRPSGILAMVPLGSDLYVTTGASGGLIYKVGPTGSVSMWFNVAAAMKAKGHPMNIKNSRHGGIRSIAFHPSFKTNGKFYISAMEDRPSNPKKYVYFSDVTNPVGADSVVLEFTYSHIMKKVLPGSHRHVLRVGMPEYDHPIKQIAFLGNTLLIGHGDASLFSEKVGGGLENDGMGKLFRINPLQSGNKPYTIPPNNPFLKTNKWKNELFAVGFRNPHNLCVSKRYGIFVVDVGRDNIDEINIVKSGRSYGWPAREGTFVHLWRGGIVTGVAPLPANDTKFGFTYPNVQVGHEGPRGGSFFGIALAGACPVETSSELKGLYLFANFGKGGELYYSSVSEMTKAVVQGPPAKLTQATVYRAPILFDHDRNPKTPSRKLKTLLQLVRLDGVPGATRTDVRFGRGSGGELYMSSKANGIIYKIINSVAA